MNLQEAEGLLQGIFPIPTSNASLELVGLVSRGENIHIQLRLIFFDNGSIRHFIEQEIYVGDAGLLEWPHLEMYFRAYAEAVTPVLARAKEPLMPDALFPKVFLLKKATTQAEYQKALSMKTRLGKFL